MKSFVQQLNAYGFIQMQWDVQRSASLPEFLVEEAAASAHRQVQQLLCTATNAHHNPLSFNRAHPWLLETSMKRAALKRRATAAAESDERPLQKPRGS
ncbi:hypothetical protein N310_03623, partial [Acanthisitta chloris]